MAFCFCGVCIPYNAIWPIILIAAKYLWDWVQVHVLGREVKAEKGKAGVKDDAKSEAGASCCSGKAEVSDCAAKNKSSGTSSVKSSTYPASHFYLTEEHDLSAILKDAPTVLKFTASWCKPCKKMEPFVDVLSRQEEYRHIHFVSVDVDENEDVMTEYSVTGIPVFVCMHGELEHSRMTGADEGKLIQLLSAAY